jgi:hypothetical protein
MKKKSVVDIESCASCKRFKRSRPADTDGECRRYPPTVLQGDDGPICLWPSVDATDICGEYCRVTH